MLVAVVPLVTVQGLSLMKRKIKVALCFAKEKAFRKANELLKFNCDVEIKIVSAKKNPKIGTRPFMVSAICRSDDQCGLAKLISEYYD
jgi:hypothetical protein